MAKTKEEKLQIKLKRLDNLIKQKTKIFLDIQKRIEDTKSMVETFETVSYTHLTLPTN